MPIAFVQGTGNEDVTDTVSTLSKAFTSNVTSGSNLYVSVVTADDVTHNKPTDTRFNDYVKVREFVDSNANRWTWWEARNTSAGACTVTATISGNRGIFLNILEYSGVKTSASAYDTGSDTNAGSASTTMNAASVTPSTNGALILCAAFADSAFGTVLTGTSGYTKRSSSGALNGVQVIDFVQSTAGATTPSGTWASSTNFSASAAVFLPPAAGGSVAKGTLGFFLNSY